MLGVSILHASGESSPGCLPPGTHGIVKEARDEAHLAQIAGDLERAGVAVARVVEDCAPYEGSLMAVGIAPTRTGGVRKLLWKLPLLR